MSVKDSDLTEKEISINQLKYEDAFSRLQEIVASLESQELTLDEALALFERGRKLAQHCTQLLDQTELKIQQIIGDEVVDMNSSFEL